MDRNECKLRTLVQYMQCIFVLFRVYVCAYVLGRKSTESDVDRTVIYCFYNIVAKVLLVMLLCWSARYILRRERVTIYELYGHYGPLTES